MYYLPPIKQIDVDLRRYIDRLVLNPDTGCLLWPGTKTDKGYARVQINGKKFRLHRLLYERFVGAIPDGLVPDHQCDTPACCNWDHLRLVTSGANVMRGTCMGAVNIKKTHCLRGHELLGENLRIKRRSDGRTERVCRECHRSHHSINAKRLA